MNADISFAHVRRLSDDTGILEHAWHDVPRRGCGYNVDDVARALVIICREAAPGPDLVELAERYLAFLWHARREDGRFHNCLAYSREWLDEVGSDDCHGRALWALGVAARHGPSSSLRASAAAMFELSTGLESPHLRANAYAILGAVEMIAADPSRASASALLERCTQRMRGASSPGWPWPEARLSYDNARIPQALMLAGHWLGRSELEADGLRLLEWLVGIELSGAHFSFTPVGGWAHGECRPGFDQQPIEAAAMADACAVAFDLDGGVAWARHALRAANWFVGRNDINAVLLDSDTGGCADGLEANDVNLNQGAESTLASIAALQQARHVTALLGDEHAERLEDLELVHHGGADREVRRAVG